MLRNIFGEERVMITLVEARHYKCLRFVRQKLERFQVLVGPNASGKSTFLDVIAFIRDLLNEDAQTAVRHRAQTFCELVWKEQGDEFEIAIEMDVPKRLVFRGNSAYRFCRYEVRLGVSEEGVQPLGENFWLLRESKSDKSVREPTLFPIEPQDEKPIVREPRRHTPAGWRRVVTRMPDGRVYFRAETTGWNAPFRLTYRRAALANLPEDVVRFPISLWARQVLMEGVQPLQLNSIAMRNPCPPDSPLRFQPDGSNLPIVIRDLKRNHPDRFECWMRHIKMALPDIQDIDVRERPEDRYLYLVTQFNMGTTLPQWLLSDGTLRFLALTLLAYLPLEGDVYLIEEPENGIHPRAVEAVFQSLSSAYDVQVLVATHSPVFLSAAEPGHLLCFARTQSGATDIVNGDDHPQLRQWRGEVNLSTLFAAGVLG